MSAGEIIKKTVVPSLGAVVCVILFLSPMKAVLQARKTQSLAALNVLPFTAIVCNCLGQIVYSYVLEDPYIFSPNLIGLAFGLFYMLSTYQLASSKARNQISVIYLVIVPVYCLLGFLQFRIDISDTPSKLIWGVASIIILVAMYGSPLSTMLHVVRTRNSASILVPLSIVSLINTVLWSVYGVAINDYFVAGPNMAGVALSIVQLALCCMFPRKSEPPAKVASRQTSDMPKRNSTPHGSGHMWLTQSGKKLSHDPMKKQRSWGVPQSEQMRRDSQPLVHSNSGRRRSGVLANSAVKSPFGNEEDSNGRHSDDIEAGTYSQASE